MNASVTENEEKMSYEDRTVRDLNIQSTLLAESVLCCGREEKLRRMKEIYSASTAIPGYKKRHDSIATVQGVVVSVCHAFSVVEVDCVDLLVDVFYSKKIDLP